MQVEAAAPWSQLVDRPNASKWILDPTGDTLPDQAAIPEIVAIGPEGGWTEGELSQATDAGWKRVRLPGHILRVETAAIAIAAWWRIHS